VVVAIAPWVPAQRVCAGRRRALVVVVL